MSNQAEADLKNKDWVFINYTYKRFEGLTARGAIPSYMKSGKRWTPPHGCLSNSSMNPEGAVSSPERTVCVVSHSSLQIKRGLLFLCCFPQECFVSLVGTAAIILQLFAPSNASEGTSLLPAHNDTELGIICPLAFSTSGCRWFSSLLIAPLMFPVCKMSTLLLDLPSALVFPNQHIPLLEIIFLNMSTWRWHQIVTWHEIDAFQGFPSYVSFFWACLKCCWLLKIKPKTELNVWSLHFFTSTNSVVLV